MQLAEIGAHRRVTQQPRPFEQHTPHMLAAGFGLQHALGLRVDGRFAVQCGVDGQLCGQAVRLPAQAVEQRQVMRGGLWRLAAQQVAANAGRPPTRAGC
jgi:hypothetical protein